ncbi:MAG: hypothetical protein HUJ63_01095 [Enterococcus sp.]|nr:hypothetical protein [Enterococcus sp.]
MKAFDFIKAKNKKQFKIIMIITIVAIITLNFCLEMILLNIENVKSGITENDNLQLIQLQVTKKENGKLTNNNLLDSEKTDEIAGMEHVEFVFDSCDLIVGLQKNDTDAEKEDDVLWDLFVNSVDERYCNYFGVEKLEDDVIYVTDESDKDKIGNYYFRNECESLTGKIKIEYLDTTMPLALYGQCIVNKKTFDKIYDLISEGYVVNISPYDMPSYFIGTDTTEAVQSVAIQLQEMLPESEWDSNIFYQSRGLENFVQNASNMLSLQIVIAIMITIVMIVILMLLVNQIVTNIHKDLMVLYVNGMSKTKITTSIAKILGRFELANALYGLGISAILYVILTQVIFSSEGFLMNAIILFAVNAVLIIALIVFIDIIVKHKVKKAISNENITKIIRI